MRERGSRAFLIGTIPVPGVPVMHPRFDPIWSAATDLGMVALLHVGYQPASFDAAWANTAGDMMLLRQLGVSQGHQSVELMLNGMVFGGTFDRHPDAHRRDRRVRAPLVRRDARPHGLPRRPRVPGGPVVHGRVPVRPLAVGVRAPERARDPPPAPPPVTASLARDVSRNASCSRRTTTTTRAAAPRPRTTTSCSTGSIGQRRDGFLGGNIAECYARMGDPLAGHLTEEHVHRVVEDLVGPPPRRACRSSIRGWRCSSRGRGCRSPACGRARPRRRPPRR